MIFGSDRAELRRMYASAWRKAEAGEPLSPLEAEIAAVVGEHPEYHAALADDGLAAEYTPEGGESNPFLHMGLHLAVREQAATDRPPGIRAARDALAARLGDRHAADHAIGECLAEALWRAQRDGGAPDERAYLEAVRRLAGSPSL